MCSRGRASIGILIGRLLTRLSGSIIDPRGGGCRCLRDDRRGRRLACARIIHRWLTKRRRIQGRGGGGLVSSAKLERRSTSGPSLRRVALLASGSERRFSLPLLLLLVRLFHFEGHEREDRALRRLLLTIRHRECQVGGTGRRLLEKGHWRSGLCD